VRMYDLTGRMITNTVAKRNDLSVDLSAYPANIYKLVVTAADGSMLFNTKVAKK
jgi:hypothetical protein